MPCDFQILEPVLRRLIFILRDFLNHDYIGGDGISGRDLVQGIRRLDFVGHTHGVHKAGDVVTVDESRFGLGVDGNDPSGEVIALDVRTLGAVAG